MMRKLDFCKHFLRLRRKPMRFDGRPYLPAIYAAQGNLVLRSSRQSEKSTFLCNTLVHQFIFRPNTSSLLVCPRMEQARMFFRDRLQPAIEESPYVQRILLGKSGARLQLSHTRFANGSSLFIRAAFRNADTARGISADLLLVDEFQDIAPGDLPVLQETLSHSRHGRTILAGTPKLMENHLEGVFRQSTANEWTVDCPACGKAVVLDERALGPLGITSPCCETKLDVTAGRWAARNPDAAWGIGFWVNHLMVPWINYDEVLQRQHDYDLARFKDEVLGLPTSLGEHVVTRAELESCCTDSAMAHSLDDLPMEMRGNAVVGIDWGGGGSSRTVVVVGFMRHDYVFEICHLAAFLAHEDHNRIVEGIVRICRAFGVRQIASDGAGNGHVYNRLLLEGLHYQPENVHAMLYAVTDQPSRHEGNLWKWTVNRSATIGALFSRVKKRRLLFPRIADLDAFSTSSPVKSPNTMTTCVPSDIPIPPRKPTTRCSPRTTPWCWQ